MEVLLLQDIEGIGKKNDLIVVGDGYALNCLLPKRVALVATPVVRKRYAELIKRRAMEREKEQAQFAGLAGSISGKTVSFKRKTTKTGKLYAAITEKMIAEALQEQLKLEVKEEDITLKEHIKSTGAFQTTIQLGNQSVPVNVTVAAE